MRHVTWISSCAVVPFGRLLALGVLSAMPFAIAVSFAIPAAAQGYYSAGDGLRFGVFGNVAISNFKIDNNAQHTTDNTTATTLRPGASFGYDWRRDRLVLGIEADAAVVNGSGKAGFYQFPNGQSGSYTVANNYVSTFRGRLGWYARPDILIYGTLGYSLTQLEYKNTCGATCGGVFSSAVTKLHATRGGIAAGIGTEYDFYGMRFFGEYLFSAYDKWGVRTFGPNNGDHINITDTTHQLRLGLKFNLNPEYDVRPYK